jgi:hypothetical protein
MERQVAKTQQGRALEAANASLEREFDRVKPKTLGETIDAVTGPLQPILDLWGELRRVSGETNFPALLPGHVEAIALALEKCRQEGRTHYLD